VFNLFSKKHKKKESPQMVDLNGNALKQGDIVISHRYDLDKCVVGKDGQGFYYESIESKKKVYSILMVDAANERQKVSKVDE
jgi:hypothetical protein